MPFSITGATGCISGTPTVTVYDSTGKVKICLPPGPPGTVLWGSITGTVTNQTDLINYLGLNFYPLSSNPAGYLTDAPSDGSTYGRNNGAWTVVSGTVTPAALTKTDDTNVTLTLGGSPSVALLAATSLTLGWTGTLATGRGGTGLATIGTDGQLIRVNTGATALEYFTPTYLTAVPTLQEVLIAGSTLTQDNTIDGGGFTQVFNNNYKFNIVSEQYTSLEATDGTKISQFNLYPQSDNTNWRYDDGGGNTTDIEMTGVKMYIRTPSYATAATGDVLTLQVDGTVEYQNAATTGDSLSPLLLMGG